MRTFLAICCTCLALAISLPATADDMEWVKPGETYLFWIGEDLDESQAVELKVHQTKMFLALVSDSERFFWLNLTKVTAWSEPNWKPGNPEVDAMLQSVEKEVTQSETRSQAAKVVNDARILEAATDQWAIEHNHLNGTPFEWDDIKEYIKSTSQLYQNEGRDIFGRPYTWGTVGEGVKINPETYQMLKDEMDPNFWGQFAPVEP